MKRRCLIAALMLGSLLLSACGGAAPAQSIEAAAPQQSSEARTLAAAAAKSKLAQPKVSCPDTVSEGERFTITVTAVPGAETYVVGVLDGAYKNVTQEVRTSAGDFVVSGLSAGEYTVAVTALAKGKDSGSFSKPLTVEKAAAGGIVGVWVMDSVGWNDAQSGQYKMTLNPLTSLGQLEWFTFKADGTFENGSTSYLGNTAESGTWTQKGNTVSITTGDTHYDLTLSEAGDSLAASTDLNAVTYAYRGPAAETEEARKIVKSGLQPAYAGATEQWDAAQLCGLWCLRYIGKINEAPIADFPGTCQNAISLLGSDTAAVVNSAYYRMMVIDKENITLFAGSSCIKLPYAYIPEVGIVLQGTQKELDAFPQEARIAATSLKMLSCGWLQTTSMRAKTALGSSKTMFNGYYTKISGVIPAMGY